ncbi:hypothetical protein MNBD_NITROSPINAE04-1775 [hydrothermal vent metagenome]|uniref:Flagellar FliJ protein n=1 Tax=hydrothermal vent metagenome TaxID=652676 RepID=A0A3B1BI12_9ZZZZ
MFRYRLEPLLKYRKSLEDDQRRALAIANRGLYVQINKIKQLENSRQEAMVWRLKIHEASTNSPHLLLYDKYLDGVNFDIKFHEELRRVTQLNVDLERKKLFDLVKKRRTIELHRDRLKESYSKEQSRKERIEYDEMAIMRAGRREISHA